jgi:hypothetical protein
VVSLLDRFAPVTTLWPGSTANEVSGGSVVPSGGMVSASFSAFSLASRSARFSARYAGSRSRKSGRPAGSSAASSALAWEAQGLAVRIFCGQQYLLAVHVFALRCLAAQQKLHLGRRRRRREGCDTGCQIQRDFSLRHGRDRHPVRAQRAETTRQIDQMEEIR